MSAAKRRSCSRWSVAAATRARALLLETGAGSSPRTARRTSAPSSVRLVPKGAYTVSGATPASAAMAAIAVPS